MCSSDLAANLGGSYLLRPIINRYIIPGDFLGLGKMLGILIGVYLTGVFAVYVEYRLLNKIGQRTVARMREDLFRKMELLPVGYFDTHQAGDIISRISYDTDTINSSLSTDLVQVLASVITVVPESKKMDLFSSKKAKAFPQITFFASILEISRRL